MVWLIILGMFFLTAIATFGLFANIADERGEQARDFLGSVPAGSRLSAQLSDHIVAAGGVAEEWLRATRVPYGQCAATDECDATRRCIQCESFSATEKDIPALEGLLSQELHLAEAATARDMPREARIHTSIARSVEEALAQLCGVARTQKGAE